MVFINTCSRVEIRKVVYTQVHVGTISFIRKCDWSVFINYIDFFLVAVDFNHQWTGRRTDRVIIGLKAVFDANTFADLY